MISILCQVFLHCANWRRLLLYLLHNVIHVLFVAHVLGYVNLRQRIDILLSERWLFLSILTLDKGSFKNIDGLLLVSAAVESIIHFYSTESIWLLFVDVIKSFHPWGRWLDRWEQILTLFVFMLWTFVVETCIIEVDVRAHVLHGLQRWVLVFIIIEVVAWGWRESIHLFIAIGRRSLASILRLAWLTGSTKLIIIWRGFFTYSFWQVIVVLLLLLYIFRLQLIWKLLHAELLVNSKLWKFSTSKSIITGILIILYSISRRLSFLSFHLEHKNQKDQNTAAKQDRDHDISCYHGAPTGGYGLLKVVTYHQLINLLNGFHFIFHLLLYFWFI